MKTPKNATASQKKCSVAGIARPPQPDGAADQEGEDSDRREHEVQRARAVGSRCEPEIEDFARAETKNGVAKRLLIAASSCSDVDDISRALQSDGRRWRAADHRARDRHGRGGLPGRNFVNDSAVGPRCPEHAVFDFLPGRARRDIRYAKAEQPDTTIPARRVVTTGSTSPASEKKSKD